MKLGFSSLNLILILLIGVFVNTSCSHGNNYSYNIENDMESIGKILSKKDVIVIAEPTHWSSDIDRTKIEMIKFLNENYSYNTVALETSRAELDYYQNKQHSYDFNTIKKEGVMEAFSKDSFDILFKKSLHNNDPFQLKGINWLPVFYDSVTDNTFYMNDIYNDIYRFDKEDAETFKRTEISFRELTSTLPTEFTAIDYNKADDIENKYNQIIKRGYFNELEVETQNFIKNRFQVFNQILTPDFLSELKIEDNIQDYYSRRGKGMFQYIRELVEDDHKVIVWVHNAHAYKQPSKIKPYDEYLKTEFKNPYYSLGYFLEGSDMDTYIIGVYFNEGQHQLAPKYIKRKEGEKDLENKLSEYDTQQLFVDLKGANWATDSFYAYDEGTMRYELVPSEQFDGILYLDKIKD